MANDALWSTVSGSPISWTGPDDNGPAGDILLQNSDELLLQEGTYTVDLQ